MQLPLHKITSTAEEQAREDELIVAFNDGQGAKYSSKEILAKGRKTAAMQAVVQCVLVFIKAGGVVSSETLVHAVFWLAYSAYGYRMFTPVKPRTGVSAICPQLAVYIVLATVLVSVVTARSFAAIDAEARATAAPETDSPGELLSAALQSAPAQLGAVVSAAILAMPVYYALVALTRVQTEALWVQLKMNELAQPAKPAPSHEFIARKRGEEISAKGPACV